MSIPNSIRQKMVVEAISAPVIRSFEHHYRQLASGEQGMVPDSDLDPVETLQHLDQVNEETGRIRRAAASMVVIKLNGGLGTGMGLDRAKSLLQVKDGFTFLDLIARQVLRLRETTHPKLRFLLMNSFSTRQDTLNFLRHYPELGEEKTLDFIQSKVPKIDIRTMEPVQWPEQPDLEWCPPGHGDLFLSFFATGLLDGLIADGVEYAFISNSDNLGAYPDASIPVFMQSRGLDFLMEVTRRTEADRKGGHLAIRKRDGRMILRESSQCPPEDRDSFQDISKHRYFNTNNIWIRLDALRAAVSEQGGYLALPLICNKKRVDVSRPDSPEVYQLETAMGAAIEVFERADALEVPRSRFAPVKKTDDLMALRSDAYVLTDDFQVQLAPQRGGVPPEIRLDPAAYHMIRDFDRLVRVPPSLISCESLEIQGSVAFEKDVSISGRVKLLNNTGEMVTVRDLAFEDGEYHLSV